MRLVTMQALTKLYADDIRRVTMERCVCVCQNKLCGWNPVLVQLAAKWAVGGSVDNGTPVKVFGRNNNDDMRSAGLVWSVSRKHMHDVVLSLSFTDRFKARFVEMSLDIDDAVAAQAIRVCTALLRCEVVSQRAAVHMDYITPTHVYFHG